ncbi:MAG: hypothetical protein ACRDRW_22325 [Pseudonocardiaceae bacterium]
MTPLLWLPRSTVVAAPGLSPLAVLVAVQGNWGAAEVLGASSVGPSRAQAPTVAAATAWRPSRWARLQLWVLA